MRLGSGLGNRNLGSGSRLNKGFAEAFAIAEELMPTAFVSTEKPSRDHEPWMKMKELVSVDHEAVVVMESSSSSII